MNARIQSGILPGNSAYKFDNIFNSYNYLQFFYIEVLIKLGKMNHADQRVPLPRGTATDTPITTFAKAIIQQNSAQIKESPLPFLQATQKILDEIIKFHSYV